MFYNPNSQKVSDTTSVCNSKSVSNRKENWLKWTADHASANVCSAAGGPVCT